MILTYKEGWWYLQKFVGYYLQIICVSGCTRSILHPYFNSENYQNDHFKYPKILVALHALNHSLHIITNCYVMSSY